MTEMMAAIFFSVSCAVVCAMFLKQWLRAKLTQELAAQTVRLDQHEQHDQGGFKVSSSVYQLKPGNQSDRSGHSSFLERTAEMIARIYQDLVELHEIIEALQASAGTPAQDRSLLLTIEFNNKWCSFTRFFRGNRIYLPQVTAKAIHDFVLTLNSYAGAPSHRLAFENRNVLNPCTLKEMYLRSEAISLEIPKLLSTLENDFQALRSSPANDSPPIQPHLSHGPQMTQRLSN